jgi:hypothetical protein
MGSAFLGALPSAAPQSQHYISAMIPKCWRYEAIGYWRDGIRQRPDEGARNTRGNSSTHNIYPFSKHLSTPPIC